MRGYNMDLLNLIAAKANYWTYIILMMVGFYALIAKNNLVKKIVGMAIFQTAVLLFYVSMSTKKGATIPILHHGETTNLDPGHVSALVNVADYVNPLPHVLMLTAIVVGVATLGVALSLAIKVYKTYGTLEEDEINLQLRNG